MPIDFNDKLRSTRRDHKLIDADEIDQAFIWRPVFAKLLNVGAAAHQQTDLRLQTLEGGGVVSRGTFRAGDPDSTQGDDFTQDVVLIDTDIIRVDGQVTSAVGNAFRFVPPRSVADNEKVFIAWVKTPVTLPQSGRADYDIIGLAETGAGYHAHTAQVEPLIRNVFDGTTGTGTGEAQVGSVAVRDSNNVLYLIRVRATTEYVTGAALHAQRSASPLEIGIANFYSKGGTDAGKLYRTLDEATDDTLEIWQVNDLAAIRSAINAGGKTDAQIGDAAFSNPPSSLSSAEKTAVREAIGAGTTAPVAGIAGLRTESIALQNDGVGGSGGTTTDSELRPAATDPFALVHPDDGSELELLSGVSGNDFTVAPGLYLITATGELHGGQVGRLEIDIRQSSDDEIVAGLSRVSFTGGGSWESFSANGYWHVTQATEVNLHLQRFARQVGVRNLTIEFSRMTVESALHSVDWYDSLPSDLMEFGVGKVVYVPAKGFYKVASNSLPNRFEGYLAEFRYGGSNLRGTSAADTEYAAHGAFAANPDGAIRAFVAHPDGTLDVLFDKGRYEAVKGSAVAADDALRLVWAYADPGSESQVAGTDTLSFAGENVADEDLRFRARGSDLRNAAVGALWAVQVQQSDGTAFFTHVAHTKHWIELSFGSVDQYARDEIDAVESRMQAEIDKLHTYVSHHIAETVDELTDPNAADAPGEVYLTRKARGGADDVAYESGLYENTTGALNRFRIELERKTISQNREIHGFNSQGIIGPDGELPLGRAVHNVDSALVAFYLIGDYYIALVKSSWFNNVRNNYVATGGATIQQGNHIWFSVYDEGGSVFRHEFEMDHFLAWPDQGAPERDYVVGGVQYYVLAEHAPTEQNKNKFRHMFPLMQGSQTDREPKVTVDFAVNPGSHGGHADFWTGWNQGSSADGTGAGNHAWTYRESAEGRLARNFNTLLDRLAGAADLASIADADLTGLKI